MESEPNNVTLVKLTKEERDRLKKEQLKVKEDRVQQMPEKDRIQKKEYQSIIIKTSVIFILAVVVLGLMVVEIISSSIGILCLVILAAISTVITRRNK